MTGREIGRIMGDGSPNGVWKALVRLEEQGIVLADHRPGATYFAANREHLAWPAIEALAGLRRELSSRLKGAIAAWAIPPVHASVFGSMARHEADSRSDVDLLLVRQDRLDADRSAAWDAQVAGLRDSVRRWTGNRCQTFIVDPGRLAEHVRANDPLVQSWLDDSLQLFGVPIRELVEAFR